MNAGATIVLCAFLSLEFAPDLDASTTLPARTVMINGAELSYVEDGQGETVIFLHGIGTDLRAWEGVRPYIARTYRFVAYSRRHHAPNAWPDNGESHTTAQHADDLAALIQALGVERAHIVGASMGGRMLGVMAVKYPDLVATMVLNDSLLAQPQDEESRRLTEPFWKGFAPFVAAARDGKSYEAAIALVEWLSAQSDPWNALPEARKQYYLDNAPTLLLIVKDRTPAPTCAALGELRIPALVMAGDSTPIAFSLSNRRIAEECLRGAPNRVVSGADHFWYTGNPRGGAQIILDFLAKHPIGSRSSSR